MKMDSNCQACRDNSTGFGTKNLTISPMPTEIANGMGFAPCGGEGVVSVLSFEALIDELKGFDLEMKRGY